MAGGAPPVLDAQPYLQQAPGGSPAFVQQTPSGVPIYPPGTTVVPLPSHAPGSIFGPPVASGAVITTPQPPGGLEQLPAPPGYVAPGDQVPPGVIVPGAAPPPGTIVAGPPNPISVPVIDEEYAWDQITDVVTDYFKIAREQRASPRQCRNVRRPHRYRAARQRTLAQPHRNDSIGTWNRWESTFQTIRRRARCG